MLNAQLLIQNAYKIIPNRRFVDLTHLNLTSCHRLHSSDHSVLTDPCLHYSLAGVNAIRLKDLSVLQELKGRVGI